MSAQPVILTMLPDENTESMLKIVRCLTQVRRERVIGGVVQILLQTLIEQDTPIQFLPNVETRCKVADRVRRLMLINGF